MKSKNSKAGGAGESFRKQVSALAELVRSRLALSLLSAFLSLAIIEGIFIIILAADVMNADHTAARKLQVLRVTEEISGALQSGKKVHHDSDEAFNRPEPPCWCESYQLTYAEMYKRLLAIRQSYIGAGLDPSEMNESIASLNKLNDVMLSLKPGIVRTQEEKKTYAQTWKQVFTSILKDLRDLHKIISGAEINKLVFGSSPGQLLVAGAAINVFFLILIIFFVDHRAATNI